MSARHRNIGHVLRLFPEAWSGAHRDELAAALASLPVDQVGALDAALRSRSSWDAEPALDDLSLLLAASCHASGYVRERAVRRLATHTGGRELPFLLVRLNDWVPQVRAVASDAISRRIAPNFVDGWVAALPIVRTLRDKGRADHTRLCDTVEDLIVGSEGSGAWARVASTQQRSVRRALVELAGRHPRSGPPRDLGLLADADPVVALGAARAIVARSPLALDALMTAWTAPHAGVRRLVFVSLLGCTPDPDGLIDAAAIASDAPLRELARFEWKRRGIDAKDRYRQALTHAPSTQRVAILRALADVAEPADAGSLRPLLGDARVNARLLAVTALARWEPLSLVPMLDDPSPKVVRAVEQALLPEARLLDVDLLRAKIAAAPRPTALAAMRIAMNLSPWRALEISALAAMNDDPVIAGRAGYWFSRMASRLFAAPRVDEAGDLRSALVVARCRLAPLSVALVEDSLRVFRVSQR